MTANTAVLDGFGFDFNPFETMLKKIFLNVSVSKNRKGNFESLKISVFPYNWKTVLKMCVLFALNRQLIHEETHWASCCKISRKPSYGYGELQEVPDVIALGHLRNPCGVLKEVFLSNLMLWWNLSLHTVQTLKNYKRLREVIDLI